MAGLVGVIILFNATSIGCWSFWRVVFIFFSNLFPQFWTDEVVDDKLLDNLDHPADYPVKSTPAEEINEKTPIIIGLISDALRMLSFWVSSSIP